MAVFPGVNVAPLTFIFLPTTDGSGAPDGVTKGAVICTSASLA